MNTNFDKDEEEDNETVEILDKANAGVDWAAVWNGEIDPPDFDYKKIHGADLGKIQNLPIEKMAEKAKGGGNMPKPSEGESQADYMARCVPAVMDEGLDQKAAVGKCEGMFTSAQKTLDSGPTEDELQLQGRVQIARGMDCVQKGEAMRRDQLEQRARELGVGANTLEAGTREEMEHTDSWAEAMKIACDHLREDPAYYAKLQAIGLMAVGMGEHDHAGAIDVTEKEYLPTEAKGEDVRILGAKAYRMLDRTAR